MHRLPICNPFSQNTLFYPNPTEGSLWFFDGKRTTDYEVRVKIQYIKRGHLRIK